MELVGAEVRKERRAARGGRGRRSRPAAWRPYWSRREARWVRLSSCEAQAPTAGAPRSTRVERRGGDDHDASVALRGQRAGGGMSWVAVVSLMLMKRMYRERTLSGCHGGAAMGIRGRYGRRAAGTDGP